MKSVFIITIAVVTMIGIIGIGYMDSAYAEMISGAGDILHGKPYGCLPYDVDYAKKQNEITITFSAYTKHSDISVAIQIDGQRQDTEILTKNQQNKFHKDFKISEKNSHKLQICLVKNFNGSDERALYITDVNWELDKVTPPNTPAPPTPMPDIEPSIDCTLKHKPQFDRYYEYGSTFEISIVNPHPDICTYEVKIYDSEKIYRGAFTTLISSSLSGTFDQQNWPDGEYFILLKSITDDKSYGYNPLTIVDKTTPIDPTIILIVIAVVSLVIIAVAVSKRKKDDGEDEDEDDEDDEEDEPTEKHLIDVKEFLTACEYGDEDKFIRKFKSGKTEQDCQKAFKRLLVHLIQQNADAIVIFYVRTLIQGSKQEPTIPKRPDAPRLSNTAVQPLRVNVTWTAPNNGGSEIISYDLYRSATGKSKGFHPIERGIRGLTFTDTLPTKGTWYYDIVANNSIGSSPPSLDASITVGGGGSGGSGGSGGTGYTKEQREAYKTLKISPGASDSEIENAFRELYKIYDPNFGIVNRTKSEQEKREKIAKKLLKARAELMKK
jgi:hypothetical protein